MKQLFSQQALKAKRVYRVESLNKDLGITSSMRVSDDGKKYVTVLCLPNVTHKTVFLNENQALHEMRRYRALYRQKTQ
jgi:hypothetical protein